MNMFIALGVPPSARKVLREALEVYKGSAETFVPEEKWHMTLVFLGNQSISPEVVTALSEPLRCAYLPAVTILSLGAGKAEGQLWAHVHATPALLELRRCVMERLAACGIGIPDEERTRTFVPHIAVGKHMTKNGSIGIVDTPAKITFAVRETQVLRSEVDTVGYEQITAIPLVP